MQISLAHVYAIIAVPGLLLAQPEPSEEKLTFEVASIKVNTSADTNRSINWTPGGELQCKHVPLRMLLTFAYNLQDFQVASLPGWSDSEFYDIFAKPSPEAAARETYPYSQEGIARLRRRTQSLLTERFGLVLHTEDRERSVYALVVSKGGPKLGPSKPAENLPASGPDGPQMSWNDRRLTCKNVTMQRFAEGLLSDRMGRTVVDRSGLTGAYDFKMEYVPDETRPRATGDTAANVPEGPTFLTALKEQLGLQLENAKAAVKMIIVDQVQHPTAN